MVKIGEIDSNDISVDEDELESIKNEIDTLSSGDENSSRLHSVAGVITWMFIELIVGVTAAVVSWPSNCRINASTFHGFCHGKPPFSPPFGGICSDFSMPNPRYPPPNVKFLGRCGQGVRTQICFRIARFLRSD